MLLLPEGGESSPPNEIRALATNKLTVVNLRALEHVLSPSSAGLEEVQHVLVGGRQTRFGWGCRDTPEAHAAGLDTCRRICSICSWLYALIRYTTRSKDRSDAKKHLGLYRSSSFMVSDPSSDFVRRRSVIAQWRKRPSHLEVLSVFV